MLSKPICLRVKGPFACFTRPEFHVERVSYSVITPSAARGILEAILMKPVEKPYAEKRHNKVGFRWQIKRLGVINKGYLMPILRNELGYNVHPTEPFEVTSTDPRVRSQRHSLILCGGVDSNGRRKMLDYLIEAVIEVMGTGHRNTKEGQGRRPSEEFLAGKKYCEMFHRRAVAGQCFYQPFLGCREFSVSAWEFLKRDESAREWVLPEEDKRKMAAIDGWEHGYFGRIFRDYDYAPVWDFWGHEQNRLRPDGWKRKGIDPRTTRPTQREPLDALAIKGWITVES